jgi:signal transduction histidine kinase/CheY-like chemotaxis protein
MPNIFDARVTLALRVFCWFASLFAILLGLAVLAGWRLDIPILVTLHHGLAAMAPLTACGLILAGVSLSCRKRGYGRLADATAAILLGLGALLVAGRIATGRDLLNGFAGNRLTGPDGVIEGHTGAATALAFVLLGFVLLGVQQPARVNARLVQACASLGTLLSAVDLLGYAYGAEGLYATAFYHSTALHTAIGLFVLFLATLLIEPAEGFAALIASGRPSGAATRMQLLLTLLLPAGAGLLLLHEVRLGDLAPSLGMAMLVVCTTLPMVVRILADARMLDGFDMQLRAAIGREHELNNALEARVEARTAELHTAEGALRQAQKMEAVGQLTGGIAHDFNNLLTGIIGSLGLMQMRIAQGRIVDLDRYITTAQVSSQRAASLIERLLAFSRLQTLDPKPTDINLLVAGMQELLQRTTGPAITVTRVIADGLWAALVDAAQVESALLNLVINARDAMGEGGRLVIETSNVSLATPAAQELDLPAGAYACLCVRDDGDGMSPEVVARAFDPFFTTKPLGQGTGLGLSMVYGFVTQSGGQVSITSQPGCGTAVRLYFPRHAPGMAAQAPDFPLLAAPPARAGETVLVVDDEPSVRMLVTEMLQDLGYTARDAADGQAALAILRESTRIDLLVSDIGLPGGLNGRDVADKARLLRPDMKVLFITGYAETTILAQGKLKTASGARDAGADRFCCGMRLRKTAVLF